MIDHQFNPQLELFQKSSLQAIKYTVLNVEDFNQNILLGFIARSAVHMVIDLRLRPVFDPPRYTHGEVLDYFLDRDISYIQFPILRKKFLRGEASFYDLLDRRRMIGRLDNGPITVLSDSDEKSTLMSREVRHMFNRLHEPTVEVLPKLERHV